MLRHLVVFLCVVFSALSKELIRGDTLENYDGCSLVVIGCVTDFTSRVGKEQKIAMEMAAQEHVEVFDSSSSMSCAKLDLLIRNSEGNPAKATASAIDLIRSQRVQAIVGTLSSQEVALISESTHNDSDDKLPFLSLSSPAIPNHWPTPTTPILFQLSNDVVFQSKCIADLVKHFSWRKITAIYEHDVNHGFSVALTFLSDSLRRVNSEIEHHTGFQISSPLLFEEELLKLKRKTNRVFVVFHFSLPSVLLLFEKANRLGMMERGYVWIISDELASLLDSVDSSFKLRNMHGVIGVKSTFDDTTEDFKNFKRRFRRAYGSEYPEEEENSSPSLFALRAYDSFNAAMKARVSSENLSFRGLSGEIGFKNGMLVQSPTFEIINLVGKSYQVIAFWTERRGFFDEGFNGPIHWAGGSRTVPKGRALSSEEKPLRISVPANGAFPQFVHVRVDVENNVTNVTGLSISVFQAVLKRLSYQRPYEFIPFYGTYDQMVQNVQNQEVDGVDMAVGDICIISDRFEHVEFTQPYLNSGLQMVVVAEADRRGGKWMFMEAFSRDMWIQLVFMHFSVCSVVCIIEIQHGQNRELGEGFGAMLWFSVTTLFLAQREPLTCNLARFVLAPWLFAILIVGASFTASLSSMLTVPRISPYVLDINTLLRTNATVGCNGKSFIVRYLVDTLNFKRENVKNITSMDDYPVAFENGDIKAAFFVAPHAEVFLAKNCRGFTYAGPTHTLGGLGFAVKKESPWAIELSKAIIEVIQSKEVERLKKDMLSSFNCTLSIKLGTGPIGPEPFSGMFSISGVICVIAFLVLLVRRTCKLLDEASSFMRMKAMLASMGFWRWACRRKLPSIV